MRVVCRGLFLLIWFKVVVRVWFRIRVSLGSAVHKGFAFDRGFVRRRMADVRWLRSRRKIECFDWSLVCRGAREQHECKKVVHPCRLEVGFGCQSCEGKCFLNFGVYKLPTSFRVEPLQQSPY